MKICPYNRAREEQEFQQENVLDETGNQTAYKYQMVVKFYPTACYGEQCGAWRDGKCMYNAGGDV